GIGEPVVAGVRDAVELEQPVTEAVADLDLTRAHLAGRIVVGDERLRARAARRAADREDRLHRLLVWVLAELGDEPFAVGEHLAGEAHERIDLQVCALDGGRLVRRLELERTDAARADVAEPLHDVEARLLASLR